MEMGYVVTDAGSWEVEAEAEETAKNFDVMHYAGLLDKAWREVAYVFGP